MTPPLTFIKIYDKLTLLWFQPIVYLHVYMKHLFSECDNTSLSLY